MQIQKTRLPHDTTSFLSSLGTYVDVDNLNLLLNRYIEFDKSNKVAKYTLELNRYRFYDSYKFIEKQRYLISKYKSYGYEIIDYKFKPYERIIIGLGQESVREVSMTLHWIYGIPYIPGQAIKGAISNWIAYEDEEQRSDANFKRIFGDEDNKGNTIFLDAYPINNDFHLKVDIVNAHYPDYYTGRVKVQPPTDWQNPSPVFFLTVEKVVFRVCVIYLEKDLRGLKMAGKTLEEWMKEAFKYGGIGAKTSLGYGMGELIPTGRDR